MSRTGLGLLLWIRAAHSASEATQGGWVDMPVVAVEDLDVEEFVARFVSHGIPVVLRRRDTSFTAGLTVEWLAKHCSPDGNIHMFERDRRSTGWAGFGPDSVVTLRQYLTRLRTEPLGEHYGFDFRPACDCAALLDRVDPLEYFNTDVLPLDPQVSRQRSQRSQPLQRLQR